MSFWSSIWSGAKTLGKAALSGLAGGIGSGTSSGISKIIDYQLAPPQSQYNQIQDNGFQAQAAHHAMQVGSAQQAAASMAAGQSSREHDEKMTRLQLQNQKDIARMNSQTQMAMATESNVIKAQEIKRRMAQDAELQKLLRRKGNQGLLKYFGQSLIGSGNDSLVSDIQSGYNKLKGYFGY